MNKLRRSYEARVLVVPLDERGYWLTGEMASAGLEGVMTLVANGAAYDVAPLAQQAWTQPGTYAGLDVVSEADMAVLLVGDLSRADTELCRKVAAQALTSGTLIAALLVGESGVDAPEVDAAMATLRQTVDMVVSVRSLRLATPFVDVLRGGPREPTLSAS